MGKRDGHQKRNAGKEQTKMTTLAEIVATESQHGDAIAEIDIGFSNLANRIRAANAEMARMIEQGALREAHRKARNAHLLEAQAWIQNAWRKRSHWFANGSDITPENVAPKLMLVESTEQQDLFRLARYTWSLPYSRGYGRRLRFLIVDEGHDALMGVLGLQSAPINFSPRDSKVSYPDDRKVELVNQTMDAFTLGAVPPYNRLLGGKLVVCAAASKEIADAYREKYSGTTTWIDGNTLPAHLVMVTTTSAYGRSSIYNRVTYRDADTGDARKVAVPLGYTKGYGNFHLHDVYQDIKKFLIQQGYEDTNKGYGRGPKPVWQNISKTLTMLGMSHQGLNHGIPRQAWGILLAKNAWDYLNGEDEAPDYYDVAFEQLAAWWKQRWLLTRAERVTDWQDWRKTSLLESITVAEPTIRPVSANDTNGMSSQDRCIATA